MYINLIKITSEDYFETCIIIYILETCMLEFLKLK